MGDALSFLPGFFLRQDICERVLEGRSPLMTDFDVVDETVAGGSHVRILSGEGELLAVGRAPAEDSDPVVRLERVLAPQRT
jgi:hypothetical protein